MDKIMNVANDVGYGFTKIKLENFAVKVPSVIAALQPQNINAPVTFDNTTDRDRYFADFLNHLDVSISSSEVASSQRYLVGQAAVDSQLPLTSFDVSDFGGKSEDDLSLILTLSLIAGKRVQAAYLDQEDLNVPLHVTVNMATALPVSEGKRKGVKDAYINRYKGRKHTVTFHNFRDPITVTLDFKEVYVGLEGEVALFYLRYAPKKMREALYKQLKTNYPALAEQVTPDQLVAVPEVMGIDIGEGSTDINIVTNGKANADVSSSLLRGYGNALTQAISVLQSRQMGFDSRAQLQDYLAQEDNPFTLANKKMVEQIVYAQLEPFADQILREVSNVMRNGGAKVALVYVFGGGAIPMHAHSNLPAKLTDKLTHFRLKGGLDIPVIWLPDDTTQIVNELALDFILAQLTKSSQAS